MKKLFTMLLTILSCVVSAYAQSFEVDGISYNVTKQPTDEISGEVEVTGGEIKEVIEFPEAITYNDVTYTVTSIGNRAFSGRSDSENCTKKYIIPGTVRTIGNSAFYDNYYLEEVEFHEGLQTIGATAFGYNFELKEIRIPSTVTSLAENVFLTNQQNKAAISCLAETPPSIQASTFSGRTDATLHVVTACADVYSGADYWKEFSEISDDITYTDRCYSPVITLDNDLVAMSCKTEGATIYYTTNGTIPDENAIRYTSPISYTTNPIIRAIAIAEGYENSAIRNFYDREQIEHITDAQGVQYTLKVADDGSFYYSVTGHSDELNTEIIIPDDLGGCPVKTIEERVFYGCSSLSSITIPESVTSIGNSAFHNCSGLKMVTSEISTPFDVNAFNNFDANLVVPQGSRANYKSVNGWDFAFTYEEGETIYDRELTDEQGVKYTLEQTDGSVYYAVTGHSDELKTEIVIPDNLSGCPVRTIESWVFNNCSSLSSITIPESVTSIGDLAFYNCSGLKMVTSEIATPFDVNAFETFDATLVVPKDSRTDYKSVNGWNFPFTFEEGETIYDRTQTDEQGVQYTLKTADDGSFYYSITGHSDEMKTEIVIPDNLSGCPVTTIEGWVFNNCSSLSSITIPESVTTIRERVFEGCTGLTSVILGDKLTTIGEFAFAKCTSLTSISALTGVTTIGARAFQDCGNLSDVVLGDQLTSIGEYAFTNCASLSSIIIPNSVNSLGKFAFSNCTGLTSVTIGSGITNLEIGTFYGCSEIKTITIPNNVTCIEDAEGGYADGYKYTYYGDTYGVFARCSGLTSVVIPNSVTKIGKGAFYHCNNLGMVTSEITTPFAVNAFDTFGANLVVPKGSRADYKNVYGWNFAFTYEEGETVYDRTQTDEQGVRYTLKVADEGTFYYAVTGHSDEMDAEIVIPEDLGGCPVTNIGDQAFSACSDLESIDIPNSVITIGNHAFQDCSSLESFIIPNSVANIGNSAFSGCSSLSSLTIPNNVTSLGGGAFADCHALTTLKIGNGISCIGDHIFANCENLSSVKIGKNVISIGESAFNNCSSLTSITLPDVLESIGASAFQSTSLTSINIPGSVKTIGNSAFSGCGSLSSVNFEEGITTIDGDAFRSCALTTITIPNSVTSLGGFAFAGNSYLTSAVLGDGITEIAGCLFQNCHALSSIIIPEGVTHIGNQAFLNCALTSIKLPESLTSIEVDNYGPGTFGGCPLKSIELPNAFTAIPEGLFQNNNFQYIKLGNSVKSIGKNAFGSSELVMEIGTSTPPTIDKDAFPRIEYLSDITVIVPDAKAETKYKKATVWEDMTYSNQANISEVTVETPGDLSFELITQCNMMPAKVVGLKVNGTINADDFTQMLVNMKALLRLDLSDCDITEIPDNAMNGKTQLQELTLPDKLQIIGKNAFRNCPYLKGELDLPSTLISIGESAFVGTYYTSVKLPSTLKTIGDYAFNNVPISQELSLPSKVTSVGAYAFAGTQITKLGIPDGIKTIGDNAFADAPIQGHIMIHDGVTYLGSGAFKNTQISTVFLPNSVSTLSQGLFQGCSNLNVVYVPDNITELSGYAFEGCSGLTTLRLSANLTSVGEYALQGTPLEYIRIPSQVEVLSRGALKNCKNLSSVTLSANLKSVEGEALTGCTALRNLSVEATVPPTIKDRSAIRGINTDKCLISIPTTSYRNYVLAEYWGQFVQMRNDIAIETAGNGDITFESVEEEEEEEEEEMLARGFVRGLDEESDMEQSSEARGMIRGMARLTAEETSTGGETMPHANNGSSVYVPQQGKVRFHITPAAGEELLSATLDGEDITPYIVDGVYTATADKKNAKLVVKFSGQGDAVLAGDVNGDEKVDTQDAIKVIQHYLGKNPTDFQINAADVNGDGKVDTQDAIQIIKIYLNKQ